MSSAGFVAGGNINPCRFVTITGNNTVSEGSAVTDPLIGISQEWQKFAPIPNASQVAAASGDQIMVYQEGPQSTPVQLEATTAGWTAGDRLTCSGADGRGVTASGTNQYGAVALTTMTGAGLGPVSVVIGKNP